VAEQGLDLADVGAALDQLGGDAVPEDVRRDLEREPRTLRALSDQELDRFRREGAALERGQEDGGRTRLLDEHGPRLAEIEIEGGGGAAQEGNEAVLLALALPHEEHPPGEVDVSGLDPPALADADPGAVGGPGCAGSPPRSP
jgi:hypothetical protein